MKSTQFSHRHEHLKHTMLLKSREAAPNDLNPDGERVTQLETMTNDDQGDANGKKECRPHTVRIVRFNSELDLLVSSGWWNCGD